MRNQKGFTLFELLYVVFVFVVIVGGGIGWVWNVVKIFSTMADPITGYFVLRCVGIIVAPLGAVLGYL